MSRAQPQVRYIFLAALNKIFDKALTEAAQSQRRICERGTCFDCDKPRKKTGEAAKILRQAGVTKDSIFKVLVEISGNQRVTDPNPEGKYQALRTLRHGLQ